MAEPGSNYSASPELGAYSDAPTDSSFDLGAYASMPGELYGSEGIYAIDSYSQAEGAEPDSAYSAYSQLSEGDIDDADLYSHIDDNSPQSGYTYNATTEKPSQATDTQKDNTKSQESTPVPQNAWSERFNRISSMEESEAKNEELFKLANDFAFVAECYGKIIISEKALPVKQKTIRPLNVGGIAGGEKFIVSGILFKFAAGENSIMIYGNEENAQKVASHELRGLSEFYLSGVDGLFYPLMALVNYLGFCLIAISLLPVEKHTLVYGSNDGGKTIHFDNEEMYEKMKAVAMQLNTKPHIAGAAGAASREIWGPGDIEGHIGIDGRLYVLDYARTFPPEHPGPSQTPEKGSVFFRLLRPEFVRNYRCPLSPDALVGWGKADPNQAVHNQEILEATLFLRSVVIPTAARELSAEVERASSGYSLFEKFLPNLGSRFHTKGINLRYLGLIRQAATNADLGTMALAEMIARVFKSRLNAKLRFSIATESGIAIEKCLRYAVESINVLITNSAEEKVLKFWTTKIKYYLLVKFEKAILTEEIDTSYDLRRSLMHKNTQVRRLILERFITLCGISLSKEAQSYLANMHDESLNHVLVPGDVVGFSPKIKNMVLSDYSYASSKFLSGIRMIQTVTGEARANRLFSMAVSALRQSPRCAGIFMSRILDSESVKRNLEDLSKRGVHVSSLGEVLQVAATLSVSSRQGLSEEESKISQADSLAEAAKMLRKRKYQEAASAIITQALSIGIVTPNLLLEQYRSFHSYFAADGIELLNKVLELDPVNPRAHYYVLSSAFYRYSDAETSVQHLSALIQTHPEWLTRKTFLKTITSSPYRTATALSWQNPDLWEKVPNGVEMRVKFLQAGARAFSSASSLTFSQVAPPSQMLAFFDYMKVEDVKIEMLKLLRCSLEWSQFDSWLLKMSGNCSHLEFDHFGTSWLSFEPLKYAKKLKRLFMMSSVLPPELKLSQLRDCIVNPDELELLFLDDIQCDWKPEEIFDVFKSFPKLRCMGLPLGKLGNANEKTDALREADQFARNTLCALITANKDHFASIAYLSLRSYKGEWLEVHATLQSLISAMPLVEIVDLRDSAVGSYHKSIVSLTHPTLTMVLDRDGNAMLYTASSSVEIYIERGVSLVGGRGAIWRALMSDHDSARLVSLMDKYRDVTEMFLHPNTARRTLEFIASSLSFKEGNYAQDYSVVSLLNTGKTDVKPSVAPSGGSELFWTRQEPMFSFHHGNASVCRMVIGNTVVQLMGAQNKVEVKGPNGTMGTITSPLMNQTFKGTVGPQVCLTALAFALIAHQTRIKS